MPIKMVVTDLDGTLLRNDKTISDYAVSIFRKCSEEGIKIVFATARPIREVTGFFDLIPCDGVIYHNGAVVHAGDAVIYRQGISPNVTRDILLSAVTKDSGAKLCVEINDRLYGNFDPSYIWPGIDITISDFTDLPQLPADKIIMPMAEMTMLKEVSGVLPEELYIQMSENTIGMIMNKNATKLNGVLRIAEHFGIELSEIAAFGDDYNDIDMLRGCGTGIAVANAIEEVKVAADYICGSNETDGVAQWLEKWINLQSAKNEVWDVYDSERNLTGRTHLRGEALPAGDYHLVVHVWLQNSKGQFLITKRAPIKVWPNMWECTGGSAVVGDDSVSAAVREVKEETGLDVQPENGICMFTITNGDCICDVWLFRGDFDLGNVVLQEEETIDAKYADTDEIRQMLDAGIFMAYEYIE